MTIPCKIIAVYDFNDHGHHASYLAVITQILLVNGHEVWLFTKNPEIIKKQIQDPNVLPAVRTHLKCFSIEMPWIARGKVLRNLFMGRVCWRQATRNIKAVVRQVNRPPDLVLFLSLADFSRGILTKTYVQKVFPYLWAGLMVHVRLPNIIPSTGLVEHVINFLQHHRRWLFHSLNIYNVSSCLFFLTLQENCIAQLKEIICKPVHRFPDMSFEQTLDNHPLIEDIKNCARGRKIICLPGNQNERKGTYLLLKIARQYADKDWFFVFAGNEDYSRNQWHQKQLQKHISECRHLDNCYFHMNQINEPALFNALFAMSDIIFAVYRDFPFSSNVLTKAALFNKPVITAGHLMGERVKNYRLGLCCDFDDPKNCRDAIRKILAGEPGNPNYAKYYELHSYRFTEELLLDLVNSALSL